MQCTEFPVTSADVNTQDLIIYLPFWSIILFTCV